MMVKEPEHAKRHRVVMISTFIGIIIVFGVWAVQIKQMFVNEAVDDLSQVLNGQESDTALNFTEQLYELVPGIDMTFEGVFQDSQDEIAQAQAQEDSEGLVIGELMKRFEAQKIQEETEAAGAAALEGQEIVE